MKGHQNMKKWSKDIFNRRQEVNRNATNDLSNGVKIIHNRGLFVKFSPYCCKFVLFFLYPSLLCQKFSLTWAMFIAQIGRISTHENGYRDKPFWDKLGAIERTHYYYLICENVFKLWNLKISGQQAEAEVVPSSS